MKTCLRNHHLRGAAVAEREVTKPMNKWLEEKKNLELTPCGFAVLSAAWRSLCRLSIISMLLLWWATIACCWCMFIGIPEGPRGVWPCIIFPWGWTFCPARSPATKTPESVVWRRGYPRTGCWNRAGLMAVKDEFFRVNIRQYQYSVTCKSGVPGIIIRTCSLSPSVMYKNKLWTRSPL